MVRAASLVLCSLATLVIATAPARADLLKLFVQAEGGGTVGKGMSGDQKDAAFFKNAPHGTYGAQLGVEVLFIDAWIEHQQFTDGSRIATWTQFGLGLHFELDFAGDAKPTKIKPKKKPQKSGGFAELGIGTWFGLGTGQQVELPLDNSEITDKALTIEGRVGLGTHLSNVFDLGVQLPVSYGFFIKSGNGASANDEANHYRGVQGEVLVYLRANIRLF